MAATLGLRSIRDPKLDSKPYHDGLLDPITLRAHPGAKNRAVGSPRDPYIERMETLNSGDFMVKLQIPLPHFGSNTGAPKG